MVAAATAGMGAVEQKKELTTDEKYEKVFEWADITQDQQLKFKEYKRLWALRPAAFGLDEGARFFGTYEVRWEDWQNEVLQPLNIEASEPKRFLCCYCGDDVAIPSEQFKTTLKEGDIEKFYQAVERKKVEQRCQCCPCLGIWVNPGSAEWTAMFEDSTINFLFARKLTDDEGGRPINGLDKAIALLTSFFKCLLYGLIFANAKSSSGPQVPVVVDLQLCYEAGDDATVYFDPANINDGLYTCEAGLTAFQVIGAIFSAMLLLVLFIQADLAGAVILWHLGNVWGKFAAFLLFLEGMFAVTAGCWVSAVPGVAFNDVMMNVVGVIFLHDLDEKVRSIYPYFPDQWSCFATVIVLLLVVGFLIPSIILIPGGIPAFGY